MTSEQLTLLAAVVAAGSSLVAVVINVRSTRTSELRQWRRQDERALIARILIKVNEADGLWGVIASEVERSHSASGDYQREAIRAVEAARTAVVTVDAELRLAFAEVELIASSKVVERVNMLERQFEGIRHLLRPASGADDQARAYFDYSCEVDRLRIALIEAARRELRIDLAPSTRRRLRQWQHNVRLTVGIRRSHWRARQRARRKERGKPEGHAEGTRGE